MNANEQALARLQQKVWDGSLPVEIRLSPGECRTYDQSDAYMTQVPRISYLPFLLPRLQAFFRPFLIDPDASASHDGWFSYEDVPLKWHYPVGLLHDLYAGAEPASAEDDDSAPVMKGSKKERMRLMRGDGSRSSRAQDPGLGWGTPDLIPSTEDNNEEMMQTNLPWRINLHFNDWPEEHLSKLSADGAVLLDAFRNSLKESSFTRHASNKPIFGLGFEDSTTMWVAVQQHDLTRFRPVNAKLLDPPGMATKGIPIRIYLPHLPDQVIATEEEEEQGGHQAVSAGTLRVVQVPVTPFVGGRSSTPQTLGTALNSVLPSLFPSRRSPLLALPVLHGAVVPLGANLEELGRVASYPDGWLHITIKMMG